MIREIKFRGWSVFKSKWVYGSLLQSEIDVNGLNVKCQINERFANDFSIAKYYVIPKSVGQFIGYKTKSEKEIYQGDYNKDYEVVIWCERCAGWQFGLYDIPTKDFIDCHNCEGNFMFQDAISEFEITGNIYQSPELLDSVQK